MAQQRLTIDEAACRLCSRCLVQRACRPMAVFRFDRDDPPVVDMARCKLCLACLDQCPFGAVIFAAALAVTELTAGQAEAG